ncbi:hypothetical protein H1C71_018459 [Ictidomys tridecemlineatus]|nr:hypothetical protein H1C71_018459 [Ictidomys tridecemlineatus]
MGGRGGPAPEGHHLHVEASGWRQTDPADPEPRTRPAEAGELQPRRDRASLVGGRESFTQEVQGRDSWENAPRAPQEQGHSGGLGRPQPALTRPRPSQPPVSRGPKGIAGPGPFTCCRPESPRDTQRVCTPRPPCPRPETPVLHPETQCPHPKTPVLHPKTQCLRPETPPPERLGAQAASGLCLC